MQQSAKDLFEGLWLKYPKTVESFNCWKRGDALHQESARLKEWNGYGNFPRRSAQGGRMGNNRNEGAIQITEGYANNQSRPCLSGKPKVD
jgi:hypothetical protein